MTDQTTTENPSKYQLTRENEKLTLTENGIKITGIFFDNEGVQLINLNSMPLLLVINLKTKTVVRIVDLDYRHVFITNIEVGNWKNIYPSPTGKYFVITTEQNSGQNSDKETQTVQLAIYNMLDLIDKIAKAQVDKPIPDITSQEKEEKFKIVILTDGQNTKQTTIKEKEIHPLKPTIIDEILGVRKSEITTIHKEAKEEPILSSKEENVIIPKVISKANCIRMKTKYSKINIQVEEIEDTMITEYKWTDDSTFEVNFFLEYNPRLNKTKIQTTIREDLEMLQKKENFGRVLYKNIIMECEEEYVGCLTHIKEEVWRKWNHQKLRKLARQHYVEVLQEQFGPFKNIKELLSSKIKKYRSEERYIAMIEPIVLEDGTLYDENIRANWANFEICFPNLYQTSLLFFKYRTGIVEIEKINKNGIVESNKFYNSIEYGLKMLDKLLN